MASVYYMMKQFDDVLIYLGSIKAYCYSDPAFNYNYGVALAATKQVGLCAVSWCIGAQLTSTCTV